MKTNSFRHRFGFLRAAAVALLAMLSIPAELQARPRIVVRGGHYGHSHHYGRGYYSSPRTGFSLSFGTGYAGRGYYYGPPGYGYYYSRPGVRYYPNYYSVPRAYYGSGGYYHRCSDVQRALYGLGYYRGPIDGIYGPGTRGAVLRYRSRHGLGLTAVIDRPLLMGLGVW